MSPFVYYWKQIVTWMYLIKQVTSPAELKPGFHMMVRITPIATVVSRRSGRLRRSVVLIWSSRSPQSKAKDAGSSAMSLGETIEFIACFENKPNTVIFIRRANLVPCYLLFRSILRRREASRVPRRHSITSRAWCHGLSLFLWFQIAPICGANIFLTIFFDFSAIQPESILVYWNKRGDFWDSFWSSRSSQSSESLSMIALKSTRSTRLSRKNSTLSKQSRSSQWPGSFAIVQVTFPWIVSIVWTLFETTETIGNII